MKLSEIKASLDDFWDEFKRVKTGLAGIVLLILLVVVLIAEPVLIDYDEASSRWKDQEYWEDSPVSDQVRTTLLPDDDRLWLSAGLSYDFENRLKLNLGYSYITTFDTRIGIGPGNPSYIPPVTFAGDLDGHVHVLSVGLKYSFGGDEPEQQQQAVYKP